MKTEKVEIEVPIFDGYRFVECQVPKNARLFLVDDLSKANAQLVVTLVYERIRKTKWIDARNYDFSKHKWGEVLNSKVKNELCSQWFDEKIIAFVKNKGFLSIGGYFWKFAQIEVEDEND